jgi:hypothetical protein
MSLVGKRVLENNLRKSIVNYDDANLKEYTPEQIVEEIQKGERSFFTQSSYDEVTSTIRKSEMSEEASLKLSNDLSKLEKVAVINKGEVSFGYFSSVKKED